MSTVTDWAFLFAFVTLAGAVSYNAFRFGKESDYLKNKHYEEGYTQGHADGFLDGIQFIDDIIPPKRGRKKK